MLTDEERQRESKIRFYERMEKKNEGAVTSERMTHGVCSRCGQAPAHFMPLKLCDACHEGLSKIPAPKDEKAPAKEWNDYAAARRAYLEKAEEP